MTALGAMLTRADRQRLLERLAELRDTDREMRQAGTLAAPREPVPLHRLSYHQEEALAGQIPAPLGGVCPDAPARTST